MGIGFITGLILGAAVSVIILLSAIVVFAKEFANEAFKEVKKMEKEE